MPSQSFDLEELYETRVCPDCGADALKSTDCGLICAECGQMPEHSHAA